MMPTTVVHRDVTRSPAGCYTQSMLDPDLDKRLKVLEQSVAASASSQRLGLLVSLGFVGFTIWQYFFAPPVVMTLVQGRPAPDCDDA